MTIKRQFVFVILLGSVCAGLVCRAGTWYVSALGDDAGGGTAWPAAKRTIQAAIASAAAGDTVLATNGVSEFTSQVTIEKPVEVRSVNHKED